MKRARTVYEEDALELLSRYQPISAFKLARRIQPLCKLKIYPYEYVTHCRLYSRLLMLFHKLEKDGIIKQKGAEWVIIDEC